MPHEMPHKMLKFYLKKLDAFYNDFVFLTIKRLNIRIGNYILFVLLFLLVILFIKFSYKNDLSNFSIYI